MSAEQLVALVGNPNCGKSVLFNALTGQKQTVGNWSGVTVDRQLGTCALPAGSCSILDLPGIHTTRCFTNQQAIDARISCQLLGSHEPSLLINVIDACHLEKGLALTQQLRRLAVPMLLVVNKMDLAQKQGLLINTQALSKELACPVLALSAKKGSDIATLRATIEKALTNKTNTHPKRQHDPHLLKAEVTLAKALHAQAIACPKHARDAAEQLLCGADIPLLESLSGWRELTEKTLKDLGISDPTTLYYQTDYSEAKRLCTLAVSQKTVKQQISKTLDNVFLHRWFGVPLFFFMMYLLFFFAINIGGAFQDALQHISEAILVRLPTHYLTQWHAPGWLISILANGIGRGICTTITFIPVIAALFLFLSLLEETGYLARGAFVIDRLMQTLKLPGQAFIPMIIGFGCNVPAIMSTRSLNHTSDRIITALMAPFMSCGARLAIFAIVANAFFMHAGSLMVFLLYLIGLTIAILTGLFTRRFLLHNYTSHWLMSLPDYQCPSLRSIMQRVKRRVAGFVKRAGKVIIPTCALIGVLMQVNVSFKHGIHQSTPNQSALAQIGRTVTPIFRPMGIEQDNWPATVGLATGIMAKEVVIATLNTLYQPSASQSDLPIVWSKIMAVAANSIMTNLKALPSALINPVLASAADESMGQSAYHHMQTAFAHPKNAFCYLLFILLYFPCISTLAAMRQELGTWWGNFSITWSTCIAYLIATDAYQLLSWRAQPLFASIWLLSSALLLTTLLVLAHRYMSSLKTVVSSHTPTWKAGNCSSQCSDCHQCPTPKNDT